MPKLTAIYGSPRRKGNTATLLKQAVSGAADAGALVKEVVLRDVKMSRCLEIYGWKPSGRCAINDEFNRVADQIKASDGLMLASPVFFYAVTAHTKILMDRCQSLWVKKYWVEQKPFGPQAYHKKGLFISAGATHGRKLFDGAMMSIRYFFDVLDMELWRALLYRGLDFEKDVLKHPEYLQEAYTAGRELAEALSKLATQPPNS